MIFSQTLSAELKPEFNTHMEEGFLWKHKNDWKLVQCAYVET